VPVITPYHDSSKTNAFSLSQGQISENQVNQLADSHPHLESIEIASPLEANDNTE